MLIFPLLILLPFVACDNFWITVHLMDVKWREGCLTTAGCSQPRFNIIEDLLPQSERQVTSWPVSEHFVQDVSHPYVHSFTSGNPEDVSLSCQVMGTDHTYGFPRVCDQTASVRVFQDQVNEAIERTRARRYPTTTPPEEELGKMLIELRGKCFNATLAVQKHTERCPWCPDPADVSIIGHELPEEQPSAFSASILSQLKGEDRLLHIGFLILALIALTASAAFACILVAYMKQKRSCRQINVKSRFHPYTPALKNDDENRYDMPWEQTRPMTYWMSNKSDGTTTSPLDSSSSIGLPYSSVGLPSYRSTSGATITIPQTRLYHHISPNSSMSRHDDSGLESV